MYRNKLKSLKNFKYLSLLTLKRISYIIKAVSASMKFKEKWGFNWNFAVSMKEKLSILPFPQCQVRSTINAVLWLSQKISEQFYPQSIARGKNSLLKVQQNLVDRIVKIVSGLKLLIMLR